MYSSSAIGTPLIAPALFATQLSQLWSHAIIHIQLNPPQITSTSFIQQQMGRRKVDRDFNADRGAEAERNEKSSWQHAAAAGTTAEESGDRCKRRWFIKT